MENDQLPRFVIAAYHPREGMEAKLLALVKGHMPILRGQSLVTDRPSYAMRARNGTILEVFEWKSGEAIREAHTNPAVQALWGKFAIVCEFETLASLDEAIHMFAEFEPIEI